jgi:hypothetical protein
MGIGADNCHNSDDDEEGGVGAGDDLEFGFYRGGGGGYESEEEEDTDKEEGDGIAGILKNPNALTDSRYTAGRTSLIACLALAFDTCCIDFEQLERLGQGGFGTVYKVSLSHRAAHVTRHTSHVTRHTSHATRHTSHVTRHTSHVTRHTSRTVRSAISSTVVSTLSNAFFCLRKMPR